MARIHGTDLDAYLYALTHNCSRWPRVDRFVDRGNGLHEERCYSGSIFGVRSDFFVRLRRMGHQHPVGILIHDSTSQTFF